MITLGDYAPPILEAILDTMPEAATAAVGINFIVEFIDRGRSGEQLAVVASRVRVVDFF